MGNKDECNDVSGDVIIRITWSWIYLLWTAMTCDPISLAYLVTENVKSLFLNYIFFVLKGKEIKGKCFASFF